MGAVSSQLIQYRISLSDEVKRYSVIFLLEIIIYEVYLFFIEYRILNISTDTYRFQFVISELFTIINVCNRSELKAIIIRYKWSQPAFFVLPWHTCIGY